jgi:CheY-like chemotaxis protein
VKDVKILVADDDPVIRRVLDRTLERWGYEVVTARDGAEAWRILQADDPPALAILDWMMPGMTGLDVCHALRQRPSTRGMYVLFLTAEGRTKDVVAALEAGADDHVGKPFAIEELRARVRAGERILGLQRELAERVQALEHALEHVKQLQGCLPICAWCKKIRNDQNYWQSVDAYVAEHTDARFTHGICPSCRDETMKQYRERRARRQAASTAS